MMTFLGWFCTTQYFFVFMNISIMSPKAANEYALVYKHFKRKHKTGWTKTIHLNMWDCYWNWQRMWLKKISCVIIWAQKKMHIIGICQWIKFCKYVTAWKKFRKKTKFSKSEYQIFLKSFSMFFPENLKLFEV